MFIKLSYSCDDRKLFCELASTCQLAASGFCEERKSAFIPCVWKIAVLCTLIKADKLPSQTTSYRPISLLSAIMKLFEWVIEKHLRKHLEAVASLVSNVWHNGFRYKIYQLDLPTKLCRWLSDLLIGRVIQVKIEGLLSRKVYPKAGVSQGSNLSPLLVLSMSMTCQPWSSPD